MSIQDYLSKMKAIQDSILKYIDNDLCSIINFSHLINLIDDLKIRSNKHELKSVLHILVNIANNHRRSPTFFKKIEKIIKKLKKSIKEHFSNHSIFTIFNSNKRILLFLIENEILFIDENISSIITNNCQFKAEFYKDYFFKYFRPSMKSADIQETLDKLPKEYEEKQKLGENDECICGLIREDRIEDFISFVKTRQIFAFK